MTQLTGDYDDPSDAFPSDLATADTNMDALLGQIFAFEDP